MTRHSEHQGRVVMEKDERGIYTAGFRASCGSCSWTSEHLRERAETTFRDLLDHITAARETSGNEVTA